MFLNIMSHAAMGRFQLNQFLSSSHIHIKEVEVTTKADSLPGGCDDTEKAGRRSIMLPRRKLVTYSKEISLPITI